MGFRFFAEREGGWVYILTNPAPRGKSGWVGVARACAYARASACTGAGVGARAMRAGGHERCARAGTSDARDAGMAEYLALSRA